MAVSRTALGALASLALHSRSSAVMVPVPAHSGWGWGEPSVVACPLWDVGDMAHGDIQ